MCDGAQKESFVALLYVLARQNVCDLFVFMCVVITFIALSVGYTECMWHILCMCDGSCKQKRLLLFITFDS